MRRGLLPPPSAVSRPGSSFSSAGSSHWDEASHPPGSSRTSASTSRCRPSPSVPEPTRAHPLGRSGSCRLHYDCAVAARRSPGLFIRFLQRSDDGIERARQDRVQVVSLEAPVMIRDAVLRSYAIPPERSTVHLGEALGRGPALFRPRLGGQSREASTRSAALVLQLRRSASTPRCARGNV